MGGWVSFIQSVGDLNRKRPTAQKRKFCQRMLQMKTTTLQYYPIRFLTCQTPQLHEPIPYSKSIYTHQVGCLSGESQYRNSAFSGLYHSLHTKSQPVENFLCGWDNPWRLHQNRETFLSHTYRLANVVITLMRKWFLARATVCVDCLFPLLCGFSLDTLVSLKIPKMCMLNWHV